MKKLKEQLLEEMLSIIRKNPGVRPSELNRLLNIPHTWNLRKELLKRGLIRKERKGSAVYYYPQIVLKFAYAINSFYTKSPLYLNWDCSYDLIRSK